MTTPTPTPKPKPPRRRAKTKQDDSIPLYDGSYYLIVTRIAEAVRRETGLANKLKGGVHEATALGAHTKRRFSALNLLGKLLVALLLVGLGAGLAAGGWFLFLRPDPAALRAGIRAHLAKGELVEAREDLEALRAAVGDLGRTDRAALAEPVQSRLQEQSRRLRQEVERSARAGRNDAALAALDRLDALETDERWGLFTRAELLRAQSRREAGATYERFAALYPDSDQADDALYWQAHLARVEGRPADAKRLCEQLLWKYPKSNFRTASDRLLAELKAPPTP